MKRKPVGILILLLLVAAGVGYYLWRPPPTTLVLTGVITTNDVIVSPQIAGPIAQLLVKEGDVVTREQLLAILAPDELKAESAYYLHSVEGASSQVKESAAALRFQERQTTEQIRHAEATLAASEAQAAEAEAAFKKAAADLERNEGLAREDIVTPQQLDRSRSDYDAARAHVDALRRQVDAQRAAVGLARSNAEQNVVKRSQLDATQQQLAAAAAQRTKADVRLAYTEIHAPIDGIVDVLAARPGEVMMPGQPVLTLINPDDLWVRADVEETYIDRVRNGDRLTVRLPSGDEKTGTVFYRGVDAAFATQRDVSRTKRDLKTFEIRLRLDNSERRLVVGMTAYVLLPISQ
jgi:HlyD family secretion protein